MDFSLTREQKMLKKLAAQFAEQELEPVAAQVDEEHTFPVENFAKSEIDENNIINEELKFEITSEDEADFNKPILFNNCANPITLSYINQNIKTDYTMTDTKNPITYNGKLLERCGVSIQSIETSISFDIEIENNKNQKFRTTIYFYIPYESEEKSINDGSIIVEKKTNFNFYRYE